MKNKWLKVMDTVSKLHIEEVEKKNVIFNFIVLFKAQENGRIDTHSYPLPHFKDEQEKEIVAHAINEFVKESSTIGVLLGIDANMWSAQVEGEDNMKVDVNKIKKERKPVDVIILTLQTPKNIYIRIYPYQVINGQVVVNRMPIIDEIGKPQDFAGIFKINFPMVS